MGVIRFISFFYLFFPRLFSPLRDRIVTSTSLQGTKANIELEKPKWAAGGPVSDIVNALIGFKPLFAIMKVGARKTLIDTAEKNGVTWTANRQALEAIQDKLEAKMSNIQCNKISYPEYYLNEFHAYDSGNLEWKAAMECESATMSMALRVWPEENLSPKEAQDRLRKSFIDKLKNYVDYEESRSKTKRILDIGCSVGISTFYLSDAFPAAKMTGLDLSAYFLAIASHRASETKDSATRIRYESIDWIHSQAEATDLETNSIDLLTACYIFHELPDAGARDIIREIYRLLTPGGTVAITDNNPKSPVIQNLPAPIFTLMKSTEPWSDEYYVFSIENALSEAGFVHVETVNTDPRHRAIFARKPA
jgi:ubiquinone/menaquinone biosynthesis C-methylase UbiE